MLRQIIQVLCLLGVMGVNASAAEILMQRLGRDTFTFVVPQDFASFERIDMIAVADETGVVQFRILHAEVEDGEEVRGQQSQPYPVGVVGLKQFTVRLGPPDVAHRYKPGENVTIIPSTFGLPSVDFWVKNMVFHYTKSRDRGPEARREGY